MNKAIFGITDLINPEDVNKDDYKFIETIKFEEEITKASRNLKQLLNVDYFSICLKLPNGRKQIISNNPGNIAIPYQINGLKRLDNVFELASAVKRNKDFFAANQLPYDACAQAYQKIMNERFNVFNAFGFKRQFDGFQLKIIFAKNKEQLVKLDFVLERNMMIFANNFIDEILPYYIIDNLDLKYSRLGQDNAFRKNFIFGKYITTVPNLSQREKECLFWTRYGKSADEIASIIGLKRTTVKNYLESVREKFEVSTIQEAITLAMQNHFIS